MADHKLIHILENIGLSEHEAKVYFASLALGPSTILKIAQAAGVKRATVYDIVAALKEKGIMTVEVTGFKKLFAPAHPEHLEDILEARKELVKKNLPEFEALYNMKGGESTVKYYEGLAAVKSLYEGSLKDIHPGEEYLSITDRKQWLSADEHYFQHFIERRAKLDIKTRLLLDDSDTAREYKRFERNFNVRIKLLPKETVLTTNLIILPSRVVIHQLTPPIVAIAISSKSIITMHREMFNIMWSAIAD